MAAKVVVKKTPAPYAGKNLNLASGYQGGTWNYPVAKKATVTVSPGVRAPVGPGTARPTAAYPATPSIQRTGTGLVHVAYPAPSKKVAVATGKAGTGRAAAAAVSPVDQSQKALLDLINSYKGQLLTPEQQRTQA